MLRRRVLPSDIRTIGYPHRGGIVDFDYEEFFEQAMEMLCIAGGDGYLKHVNAAFERALGWSREELLARPFVEFVHPDDVDDTRRETECLAAGRPTYGFENRWRCHNGRYKVLRWTAVPRTGSGLVIAVAHDITDDIEAFSTLAMQIDALEKRLKVSHQRLEHLAVTDPLTGVRNRRAFEDALQMIGRMASRAGGWMSLVVLDVDRFKRFNDRFGHAAGDEVLSELGRLILEIARRSDVAARFEEEEFAVLLPDTPASGAMNFAERLLRQVHTHSWGYAHISISVGVATVEFVPGETARLKWNLGKIVSDAQRALRFAKDTHRKVPVHAADAERE
ncbi:MAG TPA: sensor domain-containing diguanylate cyclase, partial [Chromatiales bacterium]|nr:sensor domain-containing diguanylate cyclase [Chromatiales bacterium]